MSTANIGQTSAMGSPWIPAQSLPVPGQGFQQPDTQQRDVSALGGGPSGLSLIPPPNGPQVAIPAAHPSAPTGTPMQQAQTVVSQAQGLFAKLGGGTTAIGEAQASQLVSVVDGATSQLQAIAQQAGNSDPALTKYIQSELSDLATARTAYVGLAGDVAKDDQTDEQAWKTADQAALANIQEVDQEEQAALQQETSPGPPGGDGGDGGDGGS